MTSVLTHFETYSGSGSGNSKPVVGDTKLSLVGAEKCQLETNRLQEMVSIKKRCV